MSPTAPPAARPPSEYAQQQRRRILEAARRCCIGNGLEATSMADIATEAGISISLLYRYFANKRAIILAMVQMQLDEDRQGLDKVPVTSDFVGELITAYAAWGRGAADMRHAGLLSEISALGLRDAQVAEVLNRFERESCEDLAQWLRRRADARGVALDPEDAALRAVFMRCFINGLAVHAIHDPDMDTARLRALLTRALALGLGDDARD
ncbi:MULTISPECIES: TetR/AcrR family transcriptional regulator [Stenotrophomonas]|uniref:TetR/AcrR family transcriptional regulator n=1 Tax=Stenotrophomonas TaxID=40323 RepID=UPI001CF2BFCB|nr:MULTISPECIES: TetR/AcrR family transcriptional regulator [Stenotrophomonas]MCA7023694.1 TetR/AcrR family transcriptional regulator [Stenotrophomonas acidaminiphila]MCE4074255.1 TetR/AcrR family transcriptional regulator [Stenotrophomonas acidaminiphila]